MFEQVVAWTEERKLKRGPTRESTPLESQRASAIGFWLPLLAYLFQMKSVHILTGLSKAGRTFARQHKFDPASFWEQSVVWGDLDSFQ